MLRVELMSTSLSYMENDYLRFDYNDARVSLKKCNEKYAMMRKIMF